MTISATDRLAGPFQGDGSTTEFPFEFLVYDKSHLRVVVADDDGEHELTADSDFEVVLNDDQLTDPGGLIRYPHPDMDPPGSPLAEGETLVITTDAPAVQTAAFKSAGGFRPQTVEQRLDYLTILVQQLTERMKHVPEAGITDTADLSLGTATQRANRFLAFDDQGNSLFVNATSTGYPRTAAEIAAGVTPSDFSYPEGHPKRYGVVGDGLTDDTEAVRRMHAVANEAGRPVSYSGLRRVLVEADARITVNTDVDFAGCLFVLANGIKPDDEVSFDHFNILFIVEDPATPEIRATVNVTEPDNLKKGSMTPTKEWFSEPGFVYFQTAGSAPHLISSRDRQTTLSYRQSFRVFAGGQVNYPLSADVSFADTVWTRARKMSERGFVELKNFRVDSSTYNNSILFLVSRNQVRFSNLDFSGVTARFTINSLIRIECACDVYIENVVGSAQTRFQNPITGEYAGTYILSMDTAAEVYLDRVGATGATSWGVMASSHVNGLHVTNCRLNRVDVHAGGHNIFVRKCTLDGIGAVFGWGGGIFSVVDSVAIDCPVLSSRVDYGGYWFGSLHVENVILQNRNFTATVVDLGSNPIGVSSVDVPAPESIVIRNVHRIRCSGETLSGIQPVYLLVDKSQTKKVFAPATIEVSNVTGVVDTRIYSTVDLANMDPSPVRMRTQVYLRGLGATAQGPGTDPTFYVPEGVVAGVGSVSLELHANANSWFSVDVQHLTNPRLYISDCWITAVRTSNASGSRPLLQITGGEFREPLRAPGETHATIGSGYGNSLSYTSIANARVSNGFDLSRVSVLSGVIVSPGADVVLPTGVTPSDAFSGWRSTQFTT